MEFYQPKRIEPGHEENQGRQQQQQQQQQQQSEEEQPLTPTLSAAPESTFRPASW